MTIKSKFNTTVIVQLLISLTLCKPVNSSTPGFLALHYHPKFGQTHIHWVSDAIQPFHPLSPSSPLALNLSQHQGPNKSALPIRWPKHWNFSFSISTSIDYSWLISFRIDWFDLQESSPVRQFKSINSSVLSFIMVQLSHPYTTTSKTIVLTRWTFVAKVMCPLFNTMSRFVTAFLLRNKLLLI